MNIFKTINILVLLTVLMSVFLYSVPGYSQNIQVVLKGDDSRIENLRSRSEDGDYFVSALDFSRVLGINTYHEETLDKFVFYLDGSQVTFTADNPFVSVGARIFQLPLDIRKYRSEIYFPLKMISNIFSANLSGEYLFDPEDLVLEITHGSATNISGMVVEEKDNGTLLRLKTSREFGRDLIHWFDDTKYTLNLQFYRGYLDTLQFTDNQTKGLVLRSNAYQFNESSQITFRLSRYVDSYAVEEYPDRGEIAISLIHKNAAVPAPPENFEIPENIESVEEIVAKDKEIWAIDTLIIDPGHGGRDPGTVAHDGTKEKDLALDISLKLGAIVERSGLFEEVIYTRMTDKYVSLRDRAKTANSSGGKLFISIHINSNKNARVRGFSTYFLRPGKNDDALDVLETVQRENNVVNLYEKTDPERELSDDEMIALSMTQEAFVHESDMLAASISEALDRKVNWPNKGIKQAGFQVLWEVSMPNVLLELGFISNRG
ncbi:MAG: N-acetylmuramoyl-L-alanine amidase, partial [bacterium]|nr:N-acetylmuramoyl-L-alanine amidase [bacterium]